MGWTPKPTGYKPSTESFHLGRAHLAYISGRMEVEDLEASVAAGWWYSYVGSSGGV
jgi:hypothetical protein